MSNPTAVQYLTTAVGVPGRAMPVPGVPPSTVPQPQPQSDRIERTAQEVATATVYRSSVPGIAAEGTGQQIPMTQQHDPRAPWIASYPTTPGGTVGLTDPTAATVTVRPGAPGVPRSEDPRATLARPIPAVPQSTLRKRR